MLDIDKAVQSRQEGAEYDMGVTDVMYQTGKCPYALLMGQLSLEKLLKALVENHTEVCANNPFT